MTAWLDDGDVRLYHGDALETLRTLPTESVDCVVTSPPYWGLRDYGTDGQLGLEATPDLFVTNMVEVFREVRRVLAPHGTCWVNLGDSYAANRTYQVPDQKWPNAGEELYGCSARTRDTTSLANTTSVTHVERNASHRVPSGLKPKDLIGIPWRVAFALQADGWYLRSDIIWAKPNPMPESVTDRPTKSHEYVFLMTRQPRYWFDAEAVREPHADVLGIERFQGRGGVSRDEYDARTQGWNGGGLKHRHRDYHPAGRNIRSVWQIATQPYPEAHFATFPEELARRCILAGCPERVCRECGKPSERIVERETNWQERREAGAWAGNVGVADNYQNNVHGQGMSHDLGGGAVRDLGWSDCGHNTWRPGTVLDPFIGSGTTAKVARDHQRHAIGIDLNESYLELAARRLQQLSLLTETP